MTLGEKIRQLRQLNNVTQEKLAEYLNISYQAVSKWENNSALPDVSLIVPIANFFEVTTDELFDVGDKSSMEEIEKEVDKKDKRLMHEGKVHERKNYMQSMAQKYPKNYFILSRYAYSLIGAYKFASAHGYNDEEKDEMLNECIKVAERILKDCTQDAHRFMMRQVLTQAYTFSGQTDKAIETASGAASIYCSREVLFEQAYSGDKEKQSNLVEQHILTYMDLLTRRLISYCENADDEISKTHTAAKLWHDLIDDGNFLFYHCRLSDIYKRMAVGFALKKDAEGAIDALSNAMYHAKKFDALETGRTYYTCVSLKHAYYEHESMAKHTRETCIESVQNLIKNNESFDFIRDDERLVSSMNN